MNKKQIAEKNIVLDMDREEICLLSACLGIALEDTFLGTERINRKIYLQYLNEHSETFQIFAERVNDMLTAMMTEKV